MRGMFLFPIVLLCALQAGCSSRETTDQSLMPVHLPNGRELRVEVLTQSADLMRGMMFRESLAADRGMLFVHSAPGRYPYWMFQCLIPLDIIWLDSGKRIVEISPDTPPCKGAASTCPQYGGNREALYVLEIAGGMAKKYSLNLGDAIRF